MAKGTPRALLLRAFLASLGLSIMIVTVSAPSATAQPAEGRISIVPAISSVDLERGPFAVFILLEDLEHQGVLLYDDDRDTVPDREVESVGLAAFEFTLQYDPALLEVAEVEQGPALQRTGRAFQCLPPSDERGSFSFGCLSMGSEPPGPQGTLTLASVTFRPLKPGSSPLLLAAELADPLGADQVPVDVSGGAVRVRGKAELATATSVVPTKEAVPLATQMAAGTESAPSSAAASNETPLVPTISGREEAPWPAATVAAGRDRPPAELVSQEQDLEAESDGSATAGGSSTGTIALWSGVVLALTVLVVLGLAAAFRRQKDRGRA